jgi:hypothetical protein
VHRIELLNFYEQLMHVFAEVREYPDEQFRHFILDALVWQVAQPRDPPWATLIQE